MLADRGVVKALIRRPITWVALAASGVVAALTMLWYITPSQFPAPVAADQAVGPVYAFVTMIGRTFDYSNGYVGLFGWMDTPSPSYSIIVWSLAIVGMIVAAYVWGSRRGRLAVLGLSIVMVLVPALTQAVLIARTG